MTQNHPEDHVAALVLAAGKAERMGRAKVLLEWVEGRTILEHVIQQLRQSGVVDEIIVITGAYEAAVTEAAQRAKAVTLANPDYAAYDMLSSLKVGLNALQPQLSTSAALVVLGDQPQIEIATLQAVVQAYREGKGTIVVPQFNKQRGHPVLFGRAHWESLCDLPPETAPRAVLAASPEAVFPVPVANDSILRDIDTPGDYAEERKRAGLHPL